MKIVQSNRLELILPENTVTCAAKKLENTIDLAFVTEGLVGSVVGCETWKDLHHRSDHYPIAIYLELSLDLKPKIRQWAWKSADLNQVLDAAKKHNIDCLFLNNEGNIVNYVAQITSILQKIVEQVMPWRKPSPQAQSYWTLKCEKIIKIAKKLHRQYKNNYSADIWKQYQCV